MDRYKIKPGEKVKLAQIDPEDTQEFEGGKRRRLARS